MIEFHFENDKTIRLEQKGTETLIDGQTSSLTLVKVKENHYRVFGSKKIFTVEVLQKDEKEIILSVDGVVIPVTAVDQMDLLLKKLGMNSATSNIVNEIKAPMPGTILSLSAEVGDQLKLGDPVLILEAMKMENVIKSPRDGQISNIMIKQGDNVEKNQVLVSFD